MPGFSIVGHSMSCLVRCMPGLRVRRAALLAPPPPTGMGADRATLDDLRHVTLADDARRRCAPWAAKVYPQGLSDQWTARKVAHWRANADPRAVAAYVPMFARDALPEPAQADV